MKNLINTFVRRKEILTLTILILVTLAVRIPGAFCQAIWYDESITLLETSGNPVPTWSQTPTPAATQKQFLVGSTTFKELSRGLGDTDVHPPVYYSLLSVWRRIGGWSIESARLFSVFWSTASVVLLYLLLRSSGFAGPFPPSLVYSLSSGAVHYGHEARNYSFALFFVILVAFLAIHTVNSETLKLSKYIVLIGLLGLFAGLSFQTNYLTIFPVFVILLWVVAWSPAKRRIYTIPAFLLAIGISLINLPTLLYQIGARPHQFNGATGFPRELLKIVDYNVEMLWNPVVTSSGIRAVILCTVLLLSVMSIMYVVEDWKNINKRLLTLMIGLLVAPSFGMFALDLAFDKNLGKSSYVLFALPAIAVLLTQIAGNRREPEDSDSRQSISTLVRVFWCALPFFFGLQLTGINFDCENTPGFPGSSLRSLARNIEASQTTPIVVVGAGYGRGDPASVIYELKPETLVTVVYPETNIRVLGLELATSNDVWIVFAKGPRTRTVEQEVVKTLTTDYGYDIVKKTTKFAHFRRKRLTTVPDVTK